MTDFVIQTAQAVHESHPDAQVRISNGDQLGVSRLFRPQYKWTRAQDHHDPQSIEAHVHHGAAWKCAADAPAS